MTRWFFVFAILLGGLPAFAADPPTAATFGITTSNGGVVYCWNGTEAVVCPTGLQAGTAIIGKVGIDQTTPGTTNGVQVNAALPAGTNSIGTVVTATVGYDVAVPLTRTADTNAYAANDVVGAATGSTAALTFANIGVSGGSIMITSAELEIDITAVPSGMTSFKVACYSVTPPSALGDNAAFDLPSGDRASFLALLDIGTPVDLGSTLYVRTDGINAQMKLASASLFCYLVTVGAYTPASATVFKIVLHALGL